MSGLAKGPATMKRMLVHEFAALSGVTVRTLHHYDRLGLLKPQGRTPAGYRVYSESDLVRLEQIIVLKFLGLPLSRIRDLLDRKVLDVHDALRMQREALENKQRELNIAVRAIGEAQRRLAHNSEPDWLILKEVIAAMEQQNNNEWAQQYYSDEAKQKIEERKKLWTPELQEQVTKDWNALFADIEASLHIDPASEQARALVARWDQLLEGFTGGDRQIQAGLNKMYADQANWKTGFKRPWSDAVADFMKKARAAQSSTCQ